MMTAKHFVEYMANRCPKCGSLQLEYGSTEITEDYALQELSCPACDWTGNSIYKLIGYCDHEAARPDNIYEVA